jgi:hypothetical protein
VRPRCRQCAPSLVSGVIVRLRGLRPFAFDRSAGDRDGAAEPLRTNAERSHEGLPLARGVAAAFAYYEAEASRAITMIDRTG